MCCFSRVFVSFFLILFVILCNVSLMESHCVFCASPCVVCLWYSICDTIIIAIALLTSALYPSRSKCVYPPVVMSELTILCRMITRLLPFTLNASSVARPNEQCSTNILLLVMIVNASMPVPHFFSASFAFVLHLSFSSSDGQCLHVQGGNPCDERLSVAAAKL
eukprot:283815_1